MTETPHDDPHVGQEGQFQPPAYQPPAYEQPAYQPQQPAYGYQQPYGYAPEGAPSPTDRNWAAAAHWGTLVAGWLAMGFLAPLLIMLTVGNQSPFVRRHAVESLNFQISLLIYTAVGVLFSILTLGLGLLIVIPAGLAVAVAAIVFLVLASIKATNGEEYRYPLTLRFVH
jgi:uncharacterized Tic20 family protein